MTVLIKTRTSDATERPAHRRPREDAGLDGTPTSQGTPKAAGRPPGQGQGRGEAGCLHRFQRGLALLLP